MEEKELKTTAHASQDYMKLLGYVIDGEPGTLLTYDQVQHDTGVVMDNSGKDKLRRAIIRTKKEYSVVKGVGYKLAEADMVTGILTFRLRKIDNQVRIADRSQKILQHQFFDQLSNDEKTQVLFVGSVFGAIRLAAENGKRLYSKEKTALQPPLDTIELPEDIM